MIRILLIRSVFTVMAVKIANNTVSMLGKAVQYHRKKAGLSRNEFADIADVGKNSSI